MGWYWVGFTLSRLIVLLAQKGLWQGRRVVIKRNGEGGRNNGVTEQMISQRKMSAWFIM